ncbi:kelch-like protein 30 [Erpetoichthys calabaricus]|uniref:kelch-like protein 30 n=1 Tax=Erpetoichthys calabaricus TaxID=27687 RepID=UPI00109EEF40|nr:kelch-like protein 30 [Erpetoichthys calabaricus]
MVRNVDDLEFCLPSHSQSILEGLCSLRSNPKFSDVTLSVSGREFHCHRSVLALCSLYFNSMFSGDFVESISARVELHDVDAEVLDTLIDFAYTGKLTINQDNVEKLIRTSSQLQFVTARTVCSRYLQHQIDASNCLGILQFAETHGCPEIVAKAHSFLLENFGAVAQGEEFLLLDKEKLTSLLRDKRLQIREEQVRVEAALRWVRYQESLRSHFLPELLGLAHLSLLSEDYITTTLLNDKLVQDSSNCAETVRRTAMEERPMMKTGSSQQEVLVVIGGRSLDDEEEEEEEEEGGGNDPRATTKNCAFYNPRTREWFQIPDFPDYNKWGFSVVSLNNNIYVTGGSRGSRNNTWSTAQTWKYDCQEGKWVTVASMLRPRTNHVTAVLNGEIYAIGGTTLDYVEVEHYDPYSDTWSLTDPTIKYVSNFTATGCMGKLYVIGSCAVKYNALTLQCYNPVIDSWSIITSPFIPKYLSAPCSVSLDGVIYLIGDNTKKVYMYDPDANMWQKVQMLHTLHENGELVVLGSRLYVTGGHWKGMDGEYRVEMEVYDIARNAWHVESALPRLWMYSGSCSVFIDINKWEEPFPVDSS